MPDTLHEITAAVPFGALLLVGLEDARPEKARIARMSSRVILVKFG